tara:strand:+ start:1741 stop:3153 length:1413 start_codon:yes stop_codon:yes gene_type:complete
MIQVIILAGGTGEKLWPLSRQKMPKQFLKLLDNDKSLFQTTLERFLILKNNLGDELQLIIVCNDTNKFLVKQQAEEVFEIDFNFKIIAEQISKKTTTAIVAALELCDDEDKTLVITSDQIWDDQEFLECIKKVINNESNISLIGAKPYYPATRFGYIKAIEDNIDSFIEKPTNELAFSFINDKKNIYLWNTGVMFFKKKIMIDEINKNYSDIVEKVKLSLKESSCINNIITLKSDHLLSVKDISIDKSVLEDYQNGKVIEYSNYWIDIDNFKSLFDFLQKDDNYNLLKSNDDNIITVDTNNCYIYSSNKLVTSIGVSDLVIVDTRDALLVAEKNASLEVNEIVKILKSRSRSEHVVNPVCYKPWGWFINLDGSDFSGHRVKKLCVYPKYRLSLQSHKERSEHLIIVEGKARVQLGDDFHILDENKSIYIPKGVIHRMENIGDGNLQFIETQIGSYLGEDDIIRYEDDFGR